MTEEQAVVRAMSVDSGVRDSEFRSAVRERDRECIFTHRGRELTELNIWDPFHAAHVFPLALQTIWSNNNFGRYISRPTSSGSQIKSVQNGLLLRSDLHSLFDSFRVTVNPDVCIATLFSMGIC